ncbi:MAG TPA: T9SS type A sorting domain-containing protein, partial [Paludibacter sp.]|nr:T9SS type A sorting domain-containing protein [Paludibacter sp.]
FQPAGTGGINYGWRCFEGNAAYNIDGCNASADYTFPVYVYGHNPECSVTGGYVYRGSKQVSFYGYYFFADYCSDKISMLHKGGDGWIAEDFGTYSGNNFSTFGEDAAGQLYVAGLTSGKIYRISGTTTEEHHPQASVVNVVDMARAGKVRIENNHADGAGMLVNLFDAGGNSLYKATSNKAVFEVDIRTLASGVYLLQVEVNGNALVHRIIKQ